MKELETKLEALRQHSELQQDLVMNLLRHPGKDDPSIPNKDSKDPEMAVNGGPESINGITDDIVPFMVTIESMFCPNQNIVIQYMN